MFRLAGAAPDALAGPTAPAPPRPPAPSRPPAPLRPPAPTRPPAPQAARPARPARRGARKLARHLQGGRRFLGAHRDGLSVVAAAGTVFVLVFLTWFRIGHFYATGDLGLFYRHGAAAEFGALWTHENSGAGGAAYSVVRLPELALIALARLFGGGEPLAERLLFSSMFAWAAGGAAALLRRFCARRIVVVAGGVLAAFNLFTLTGLPNYLPVVVIGVIGTSLALSIDAARTGARPWVGLGLATLPMVYVSLNPPLVAVVLAWLAICPLVAAALTGTGRRGVRRAGGALARSAPLALALNLWWILPQFIAISQARSSGTIGAQTDVNSWSWTHMHNSLANVMTFRSAWTWPDPDSHGLAATVLGRPALAWLTWLFPAGLAVAPLVAPRARRLCSLLALGCVVAWLVGKGLHAPGRGFNQFLYDRVPGFWLLREPMSKVGAIPLLAMLVAWAVALEGLWARSGDQPRWRRGAMTAMATLLVAGPLVFAWPMLSGRVTRDEQPGRQEQVQLPAAWAAMAAAVNESPMTGKVLVLPLVDFYQMPTTWQFYGTDTLVRGLVDRPVVMRNPQGYLTDLPALDQLVRTTERAILDGRREAVVPLLRTLGVSHLIVRRDFDPVSPVRAVDVADPELLVTGLGAVPGVRQALDTELGSVFTLDGDAPAVQVYTGLAGFSAWADQAKTAAVAAAIEPGLALSDDPAAPLAGRLWAGAVDAGDALDVAAENAVQITRPSGPTLRVRIDVQAGAGRWRLTGHEFDPPSLGDTMLEPRVALDVELDSRPAALEVDGEVIPFGPEGLDRDVTLGVRSVVRPIVADEVGAVAPLGPLDDCYRYDDRSPAEVGLSTTERTVDGLAVVELAAEDHRACRTASLVDPVPGATYHLRQASRTLAGSPASMCLWLDGPNRCLELDSATAPAAAVPAEGWQVVDTLVTIPDGVTGARLFLYADRPPAGQPRTITQYQLPEIFRWRTGDPVPLTLEGSARQSVVVSPGALTLHTDGGGNAGPGAWSEVGDCHRTDERSHAELGLRAEPIADRPGAVRVEATEHSACVHAALPAAGTTSSYQLTLPYRTVRGSQPRVCVFDRVNQRCLVLTGEVVSGNRLAMAPEWKSALLTFDGTGNALDLYVYADGTRGGTAVEYDVASVRPRDAEVVTVFEPTPPNPSRAVLEPPSRPVALTWSVDGLNRYRAEVETEGEGFVLATTEAFDEGWKLRGLPGDATARHVRIDGYRNGWVVEGTGAFDLRIEYAPDGYRNWAFYVYAACALGLSLRAGLGRCRRPAGASG